MSIFVLLLEVGLLISLLFEWLLYESRGQKRKFWSRECCQCFHCSRDCGTCASPVHGSM